MDRRVSPSLFALAALLLVVAGVTSGLASALLKRGTRLGDGPRADAHPLPPHAHPWKRRPATRAPARPRRRKRTRPARLVGPVRGGIRR